MIEDGDGYQNIELLQNAFKAAQELNYNKINIVIVEENKVLRKWYESFGFLQTLERCCEMRVEYRTKKRFAM